MNIAGQKMRNENSDYIINLWTSREQVTLREYLKNKLFWFKDLQVSNTRAKSVHSLVPDKNMLCRPKQVYQGLSRDG